MYMALLRASLYVPTEPESGGQLQARFAQDEPLQGRPVFVAFTTRKALERWSADHDEHVMMKGTDLFPMLSTTKLGSVLINPKSDVGGELYRNEVQMLADAVPQLQACRGGLRPD